MFTKILLLCNQYRGNVIKLFQIVYVVLTLFTVFASWTIMQDTELVPLIYTLGRYLGIFAAGTFLVITIPGIFGRFGVKHPLITIGIMFRRYTGILMFLSGFYHGLIVYEIPAIAAKVPLLPAPLQVLIGMVSITLAFPLFLTSNNWSMKKLGKYWKKTHKLVYVIFWTIVLHVALLGEWKITISVACIGLLEIFSLLYDWKKKRQLSASPVPQTPVQ